MRRWLIGLALVLQIAALWAYSVDMICWFASDSCCAHAEDTADNCSADMAHFLDHASCPPPAARLAPTPLQEAPQAILAPACRLLPQVLEGRAVRWRGPPLSRPVA